LESATYFAGLLGGLGGPQYPKYSSFRQIKDEMVLEAMEKAFGLVPVPINRSIAILQEPNASCISILEIEAVIQITGKLPQTTHASKILFGLEMGVERCDC
jgi:hypothetical protein